MSSAALIMIGAGEADDLPNNWQHAYDRLILVEPIPERAAELRARFANTANAEVVEAAITGDAECDEMTTLQIFSWQAVSSRHAPADLLNLFPGLEVDRALRVRAITLSDLLESCQLDANADNGLMVDAPGDGHAIARSLIDSQWHEAFTWLRVHEAASGLYANAAGPDPIADALTDAGFTQNARDTEDPEWPLLTFSRNRWKLRSERLEADVERLTAEIAARDQRIQQLTSELDVHAKALDQRTAERDAAHHEVEEAKRIAEAEAQRKEAAEARATELSETLETHTAEHDQQTRRIAELEEQLKAKEAQMQSQANENADLQRRQELMNEELSKAEAQIDLIKDLLFKQNEEKA